MATESDGNSGGSAVYGRAPPPKVALPQRGIVLGLSWSGIEGAGNQIVAAKVECSKGKPKLTQVWRPFQDAPGRRDVREQFPTWLEEESRWAEGRLVVGIDFPFSLAETHLRQLGLLRQALRGPASLGRGLEERFFPEGADFSEAAEQFKAQLGKDRLRLADCYRAAVYPPSHLRLYRQRSSGCSRWRVSRTWRSSRGSRRSRTGRCWPRCAPSTWRARCAAPAPTGTTRATA